MVNWLLWKIAGVRHVARFGHQPEWHLAGGTMWFCMKCVRGNGRNRVNPRDQAFKMEWSV